MAHLNQDYRGRFAPSPSGPLHFGSLVAALASYLQAKFSGGEWLVRIEDLDPPRTVAGASTQILKTLEAFQLHWDGDVVYQSQRLALYQDKLDQLIAEGAVYSCKCTRKDIKSLGNYYQGTCRHKSLPVAPDHAIRVKQHKQFASFNDGIQGTLNNISAHQEDFIIKRRDNLFAYHLAVVVDDIEQHINQIVRGADIIDSTPKHLRLYELFSQPTPDYYHIPLATVSEGIKLSKQNYAPALSIDSVSHQLFNALKFLGQSPDTHLKDEKPEVQLEWGLKNWDISCIPSLLEIEIID